MNINKLIYILTLYFYISVHYMAHISFLSFRDNQILMLLCDGIQSLLYAKHGHIGYAVSTAQGNKIATSVLIYL